MEELLPIALTKTDIPPDLYEIIIEKMLDFTYKIRTSSNMFGMVKDPRDKRFLGLLEATMTGNVGSGEPVATSFGNTL